MITKTSFYDSWVFFAISMGALFIVSYVFWGVLFLGPNRDQGNLERGMHNNVNVSKSTSQRGGIPGMGGGGGDRGGNTQGGATRGTTQRGTNARN